MLSDQIESQTEKITDLERILDDKKEVLKKTEELLQREMLNRSVLIVRWIRTMIQIQVNTNNYFQYSIFDKDIGKEVYFSPIKPRYIVAKINPNPLGIWAEEGGFSSSLFGLAALFLF